MCAALLGWPQATFASEIEVENEQMRVMREVDEGQQEVAVRLPAVVTTDLRLNTPRYLSYLLLHLTCHADILMKCAEYLKGVLDYADILLSRL